jgi:hypothetical protein
MGVTGGVGGGIGEVWPFIPGEAQDAAKEESVGRVGGAQAYGFDHV